MHSDGAQVRKGTAIARLPAIAQVRGCHSSSSFCCCAQPHPIFRRANQSIVPERPATGSPGAAGQGIVVWHMMHRSGVYMRRSNGCFGLRFASLLDHRQWCMLHLVHTLTANSLLCHRSQLPTTATRTRASASSRTRTSLRGSGCGCSCVFHSGSVQRHTGSQISKLGADVANLGNRRRLTNDKLEPVQPASHVLLVLGGSGSGQHEAQAAAGDFTPLASHLCAEVPCSVRGGDHDAVLRGWLDLGRPNDDTAQRISDGHRCRVSTVDNTVDQCQPRTSLLAC